MKKLYILFIALPLVAILTFNTFIFADSGDLVVEGKPIIGTINIGSGMLEIPNSINLPAACIVGQIYMDTDAASGQRCYLCESTNVWVLHSGNDSFKTQNTPQGTNPIATSATDTLQWAEGEGIDITGDNVTNSITIEGEKASYLNKGVASFNIEHFFITGGAVSVCADGIDDGHIDWGTSLGKVCTSDIPEGTQKYSTLANIQSACANDFHNIGGVDEGIPAGIQGDTLHKGASSWAAIKGVYNALSWGATPDSSGDDDGVTINAAITYAAVNGGGTVILPCGTYHTTTAILLKNNVTLKGLGNAGSIQGAAPAGTVIHANVTPAVQTTSGTVTQNTGLENISLYTTTKTSSGDVALHLYSVQHSSFKQIYIQGWTNGTGIFVQPNTYGQYAHGNRFDDIRINYYGLVGTDNIGVGIRFDGLWNGGATNAGVTDNSWRHIQIYWPKTYGLWFRNMVDNERFYYCLIRGDTNGSTLVKCNDATGEDINITNQVFYDLTLTQLNNSGDTVTGIDFDTSVGTHEFYGLQFVGDNGGWLGAEYDISGVGATFELYGTGIRSTKAGSVVTNYKMQWQMGDRYNILNGGDQYWRDTDAGADLVKLNGSTGDFRTQGKITSYAASGNGRVYANGALATDYGEMACTSNNIQRMRFFANDTASYLDYIGDLAFRTIAGVNTAILYSTGDLALDGTLTENAWTLNDQDILRKWKLLDSIQSAYKEHSGESLDPVLRVATEIRNKAGEICDIKYGKRPSDFIQVAIECIAELKDRIEILEIELNKH